MFGFHRIYKPAEVVFGSPVPTSVPAPRIFVFAVHDKLPRVFVVADDPEGHQELDELHRRETVLRVVHGHEVVYTEESRSVLRTPLGSFEQLTSHPGN